MKKKDNSRVTLGDRAQALAAEVAGEGVTPTALHLETALVTLEKEALTSTKALEDALSTPSGLSPEIKKLVERESDQLFNELTAKIDAHHNDTVNLVNSVRHMLHVFAEEMAGSDVKELVQQTNEWLDKSVKPIAQSRAEIQTKQGKDGRPENENANDGSQHSQAFLPTDEKDRDQTEMALDTVGDRFDGRDA